MKIKIIVTMIMLCAFTGLSFAQSDSSEEIKPFVVNVKAGVNVYGRYAEKIEKFDTNTEDLALSITPLNIGFLFNNIISVDLVINQIGYHAYNYYHDFFSKESDDPLERTFGRYQMLNFGAGVSFFPINKKWFGLYAGAGTTLNLYFLDFYAFDTTYGLGGYVNAGVNLYLGKFLLGAELGGTMAFYPESDYSYQFITTEISFKIFIGFTTK